MARTGTPGGWRRSSACSGADSTCVEVAVGADEVAVRDSKDPGGPELRFTAAEWAAFTHGVRAGEFDAGAGGQRRSSSAAEAAGSRARSAASANAPV